MQLSNFLKQFIEDVIPGNTVLDLGAGEGNFSRMFADAGAHVIAVDTKIPDDLDDNILPVRTNIEKFIETDERSYDAIFMRNIIQFFDKEWVFETLLPWCQSHLATNGTIGISTFYQEPEPPFERPFKSLYSKNELSTYFANTQELYSNEYKERGLDMQGTERTFYITEFILKIR